MALNLGCIERVGNKMTAQDRAAYDPGRDYRDYPVSDADAPFLTTSNARRRLGYQHSEAVRQLVVKGQLPARRSGPEYNAPYQIPEWAVRGWMTYKGIRDPDQATPTSDSDSNARIRELEDALLVLRRAREHDRKATGLLEQALRERRMAYDLLDDALGLVVIPQSPPE